MQMADGPNQPAMVNAVSVAMATPGQRHEQINEGKRPVLNLHLKSLALVVGNL